MVLEVKRPNQQYQSTEGDLSCRVLAVHETLLSK